MTVDAGPPRPMPVDVVVPPDIPPPPWLDGSLSLATQPYPDPVAVECGTAHPIARNAASDAHHACTQGGWYWFDLQGDTARVDVTTGLLEAVSVRGEETSLGGYLACQTDAIVFAAAYHEEAAAVARFTDVTQPVPVIWSTPVVAGTVDSRTRIAEITASDQFIAWLWFSPTGPQLWIAGPHGETPYVLRDAPDGVSQLHADGPHLVFIAQPPGQHTDVWLWTVGTSVPENLTHDTAGHSSPWISGNRVVWTDDRLGHDDSDIYGLDLTTRVAMRLNTGAVDRPARQDHAVLDGDFVVWEDARGAPAADGAPPPAALYGYDWSTRREFALPTGNGFPRGPLLSHGTVYFACDGTTDAGTTATGLFSIPLPAP